MKKTNSLIALSLIIGIMILFTSFAFSELEINTENYQAIDTNSENIIVNKYDISDDYLVSSLYSTISTCSCAVKEDRITIFNAGKIPNTYQIYTNLEYVTLTENIVRLQPQEAKEILLLINTPCEEFDEELEIYVKSGTGDEKILTQRIISDFCTSFAISKEDNSTNYEPCELQIHEFTIFNTADFKDTYWLDVDKFEEDITFSENPITVSPYKNKTVYLYFKPDCSLYGNKEIILTAESEKTPLESTVNFFSSIERNYPYIITSPDTIAQCDNSYDEYVIEIYNTANLNNAYKIEIEGPKWATLSTEEIQIDAHSMANITINLDPSIDVEDETENEEIKVTITSDLGNLEIEKTIPVTVDDCYSFKIWPQEASSIKTCSDDKSIYFEVENTGTKINQYHIWLDYDKEDDEENNFTLDNEYVTVLPGQKESINIDLDLVDENSREKIKIYANTFSDYYTESVTQKLKIEPLTKCYEIDSNLKSRYTFKRNQSIINFTVTNEGFKKADYELSNNLYWVELNDEFVILNPGESKDLYFTVISNDFVPDGTYEENLNVNIGKNHLGAFDFNIKIRNLTLWERIKLYFSPEPTEPPVNCSESLDSFECDNRYEEFGENEELVINLSQYFYDPDGDELIFGVVNHTEDLDVELEEDIATVRSLNNWYGVGEIIFSASDAENTTFSDVFYVQAIDQPDNQVRIAIGKYWLIFLLILLAVLFILIILVLRSDDEKIHYEPASAVIIPAATNSNKKEDKNDGSNKSAKPAVTVVSAKKSTANKKKAARKKPATRSTTKPKTAAVVSTAKKAQSSKPKRNTVKKSKPIQTRKKPATRSTTRPKTKAVAQVVNAKPKKAASNSHSKLKRKITRRTIVEEIEEAEAQN
ncbi:hypothetical protein C0585_00740 [Candidatus Woesearchaeota archaeon]|nr:MAG: hypothetical protein C0585_00740 [Candidatus Woesearchaeota archaeon]